MINRRQSILNEISLLEERRAAWAFLLDHYPIVELQESIHQSIAKVSQEIIELQKQLDPEILDRLDEHFGLSLKRKTHE